MNWFTTEHRDRVRDHVIDLAGRDSRIVAGAKVGSLAGGPGDRWSDLDLAFAVNDTEEVRGVLLDWTRDLGVHCGALPLFDLPVGSIVYRVFYLPGGLQLDVSVGPADEFGADSPNFTLLFGEAVQKRQVQPPNVGDLFGYAMHHALRARVSIERHRLWQAEYWVSGVRDYGLSLACRRLDLPARQGRGFDDLPIEVSNQFRDAIVRSVDQAELLRALRAAIAGLLNQAEGGVDRAHFERELLALAE